MQKLLKHEKKAALKGSSNSSSVDSSPKSNSNDCGRNGLHVNGLHSKSTSSILITKKRGLNEADSDIARLGGQDTDNKYKLLVNGQNGLVNGQHTDSHASLQDYLVLSKKRKLNNGGKCLLILTKQYFNLFF